MTSYLKPHVLLAAPTSNKITVVETMAAQAIPPRTDDHTVTGVGRGCTGDNEPADDPTQPLLHDPWMRSRKVHYLLLAALGILLLGGVIVGTWLIVLSSTSGGGPPDPEFQLVNRTAWGARPRDNDTQPLTTKPAIRVVIIHTVTTQCLSLESCCKQVRNIQNLHMDDFLFSDIAYNFLVGGDGRTYEGRGWDTRGAFNRLMNSKALGIAFIGDFEYTAPTPQQLAQAKILLKTSIEKKKLAPDYKLLGHCQVSNTDSPGKKLYDIITTWPHWEQCFLKDC